jgi:hypothetical protein
MLSRRVSLWNAGRYSPHPVLNQTKVQQMVAFTRSMSLSSYRRHLQLLLLVITFGVVSNNPLCATVIAFMPGDAHFHSKLTEAWVENAVRENKIDLGYAIVPEDLDFGGYAGFGGLTVSGDCELVHRLVDHLRAVYLKLRQDDPKIVRIRLKDNERVESEVNGFHLFVYNSGTDWTRQRIGNKYNENWNKLPASAITGPDRGGFAPVTAVQYRPILRRYEAVVDDWQFAHQYAELHVAVSANIAWGIAGPPIEEPVIVKADEIQLVVVGSDDLEPFFQRAEGAEATVVSFTGVKTLVWGEDGSLAVTEWNQAVPRPQ